VRIAIIRLSALGDIINSLFILPFIKARYPDATIDWICEEAFASMIEHHELIDHVRTVAIKRAKKERSLKVLTQTIRQLRSYGPYDHVIDLQGLLKSAMVARIIGKNAHGFDKQSLREGAAAWLYRSHTSIPYRENAMLRTAAIISDVLKLEISKQKILEKPAAFKTKPLSNALSRLIKPDKKNVVITVGSSWPSKVYPPEKFAEVANGVDAHVILVWGSASEHIDAKTIAGRCSDCSIAPKLSLYELVQLISHADLTIGNDSGPTHMAWMQNRPSITLFGPTPAYKMIFATDVNIAIESDSMIDPLKLDRNDFSIRTIPSDFIISEATKLLD
jgi:heptosyltransferase-1